MSVAEPLIPLTTLPEITVDVTTDLGATPLLVLIVSKNIKEVSLALAESVLTAEHQQLICQTVESQDFKGAFGCTLHVPVVGAAVSNVLLVGVGDTVNQPLRQQFSANHILLGVDSQVTSFSGAMVGRAIAAAALKLNVDASIITSVMPLSVAFLETMAAALAMWQQPDDRFKSTSKKSAPLRRLHYRLPAADTSKAEVLAALTRGIDGAVGALLAKELVVAPPNYCNPESLASVIRIEAERLGLRCRILGKTECESRKMNAYLAVNSGSRFEPQLIHVTYEPPRGVKGATKRIVLIGKGLTMDTGGYNLKSAGIETMKFDMGGAAAVFGAMKCIALRKPAEVCVDFIVAAAENMIDARACRPGDIVEASNGKTIEINNTDAEGRLTLADALLYAQSEVPDATVYIDIATLTGAIMVGLGSEIAGVYANDSNVMQALLKAGENTGTPVWPMPLFSSYKKYNESVPADLSNLPSSRMGGSISAALFLQEFVQEGAKWAHIDIAGPVWDEKAKTATGFAARLLANVVEEL